MSAFRLLDLDGRRPTPLVRQTEASECGLACIAMVAGHHGLKTDMAALRRRFSLSLKGSTLKTLMSIAHDLGFATRPLRSDLESLGTIALPAVLHWNLNHFVVLTEIKRTIRGLRYHIHDPALGARALTRVEISRKFTGVILELLKSERFTRRNERTRLRISQLWSNLRGLGASLLHVLVISAVLQLIALAMPFYLQVALDNALPGMDRDLLVMLAVGFGGLALISAGASWLRSLILLVLGSALSYQLVVNLYSHLLRLPLPWFEKRHVGDIVSRFGSTQPITSLMTQGVVAALLDGSMAFLTLALMFLYSPLLAAFALSAWMLFAVVKVISIKVLSLQNIETITTAARENSSFIESVRGIAAIKAFGQEANRLRIWQNLKADAVNAQMKLGRQSAMFDTLGQLVLVIERIGFVFLAVGFAMDGRLTVGMVFAFQAYKQQFLDAGTRLIDQAIGYRLLDVHLNRLSDIALARSEPGPESLVVRARPAGELELSQVSFRYGAGEPEVLRNVTLRIDAGEMIAVVGPSGGGKTTFLKILMGLVDPTQGHVMVDGLGLARLTSWRRQIGSVTQDDTLFAGSLAENIAFFDPEIDMERVVEVARMAAIHDEIMRMPMAYESLVGDMGSSLSGGQRQRVLLARALYPDPVVLFVDEGTAHLDSVSEERVMEVIASLPITRVVIAHRPAAVARASKILRVKGGSVDWVELPSDPERSAERGTGEARLHSPTA